MSNGRNQTEGPLGFPMTAAGAKAVDAVLRNLPRTAEHAYRHRVIHKAPAELYSGERADISWISTESVDRAGEVLRAAGMDDRQFRDNPVVTLGHDYSLPPVGRSLWRQRSREGPRGRMGIRAKTHYPLAPAGWPSNAAWLPDQVFALVQAGLLQGKSVGFLPIKVRSPNPDESKGSDGSDRVQLVIEEWLLLEYACVTLPANQDALVEAVAKGSMQLPADLGRALGLVLSPSRALPFTPLIEIERALRRELAALNLAALVQRTVDDAIARARGAV